jgi:ribose transport system substrate-binding protein
LEKKNLKIVISLAIVVISLCILATPVFGAQDTIKIGFAHVNMNAPYYIAMKETAEIVAEEENVELIMYNCEDDLSKQIRQIMSMISMGIDGLLINPVTTDGPRTAIEACVEEGIPVVAIDRQLYGDYIAYVGIDQWYAGLNLGKYIVEEIFPDKENVVWVELQGSPGCPAGIGRGGGFHQAIEELGNGRFSRLYNDRGYYDSSMGMQIMEDAIVKAKGAGVTIDLVFGHNDAMALGAREALIKAGMTDVILCGIDGQKEALHLIESKDKPTYVGTVINWSTDITRIGMKSLIDNIREGKTPDFTPIEELSAYSIQISDPTKYIKTGTNLIYEGNVMEYYDPDSIF